MKTLYQEAFNSVADIQAAFERAGYICSTQIATCVYIAHNLEKPVMVEGPAGVGKTELAKTTAEILGVPLVRLQCYEGLDEAKALYEWKYAKQLLYTQLLKDQLGELLQGSVGLRASMAKIHDHEDLFFSESFLEPRPLYKALHETHGCVLLIDEVDKSDHEFEAFLLEVLSDFQVSIPELGTIKATVKPLVFLTSNNTREMSDALKRRCLHLYVPYPDEKLESRILTSRVPELSANLLREVVGFVHQVRDLDLKKVPSVSETIDWAKTLLLLHAEQLDPALVKTTLNVLLKHESDIQATTDHLRAFVDKVRPPVASGAVRSQV